MQKFELLGNDEDETRLLRAPDCGYSIVLAGHPRTAPPPEGPARYDIVLQLGDVAAHHGFRIDELPAGNDPQSLAMSLVTAYRNQRSSDPEARVKTLPYHPAGVLGGAHVVYPRRDVSQRTMEQIWVMVRPSPTRLWVLYHTTWFRNEDVNNLEWAHLRASFLDQHVWDATKPRDMSPTIWPPSTITLPSARLGLTEDAWKIAAGKAADVGHITLEQVLGLVALFREFSQSVFPPRAPVPEMLLETLHMRVMQHGPPQAAAVLVSDLAACKTRHDLRGWAWQCTWAIGNRSEVKARSEEQR